MPMSSGGHVASSSGCATRPKVREIGLTGCAVPTQRFLLIGSYVMAMAEHREPCDSRGSCTVLGAPGGEIPPGDSTIAMDRRPRGPLGMSAPLQKRPSDMKRDPPLRARTRHWRPSTDSLCLDVGRLDDRLPFLDLGPMKGA